MLLGGPIEYHHDFFENTFKQRFEVVQNNATTRQDFVESLKTKRYVLVKYKMNILTLQIS